MLKVFTLLAFFSIFLLANSIEDRAFNAYKNRDYVTSFKLYTKAAKSNNIKSFLMLGLFFEKGIGVKQDKVKAIKLYKHILKKTSNIKYLLEVKDYKKIDITIAALKRLYDLTKKENYINLANKLNSLKSINYVTNSQLFSNNNPEKIDDFLILCPHAKVVAPEDREGLEAFDCALFEHFPKKMALFMKLRRIKFMALKKPDRAKDLIAKIDAKIEDVINPIIDYLQQDVVSCYTNSESLDDIYSCNYDYLAKSDPLLFRNYSYKMEQYISSHSFKNHQLDSFEREDLVDKLVTKIANNTFGENWKDMVK